MISDKNKVILSHRSCAKDKDCNLLFYTAIGQIKGKFDEEMLEAYSAMPLLALDEPIEFIPLKNVTITDHMGNTFAVNTLTVYTDQVIASCVSEDLEATS